jgi:5'-3' exonuclease
MGIPSYFSWITRHFEKNIIVSASPYTVVHHLYLDFNCAIHPCVKSHPEYSVDMMCDNVIIYLDYLIDYVKPSELVYIAVDGVPPVAKMKQQRMRRYKSIQETADINQIKEKFGVDIPPNPKDFNMISPATEFMSILSGKIDAYCRVPGKAKKVKFIFSDASVPSEGEHKILQYIKTQPLDKNCIIYGLDSDLIMLSMCTERNNVALIRENNFIKNNNVDIAIDKYPQLDYFLVQELKKNLYSILVSNVDIKRFTGAVAAKDVNVFDQSKYNMERVIKDYIFMSFLLGNDFIPAFPTLKIRDGGIEKIIVAYRQTLTSSVDAYFVNIDMSINVDFLMHFVELLANEEEDTLKDMKYYHDKRVNTNFVATPSNYEEAIDQYQKVEHLYKDYVNVHQKFWSNRYYEYFFHMCGHGVHQRDEINTICEKYIYALQWNIRYYFDKCPDWHWFYSLDATPLMSDFLHYIKENQAQINRVSFTHVTPVKPFHQLMMILPPQSAQLLPKPYHSFMLSDESPLIHYYPVDFELELYGKRFRWESHPKIPLIEPNELPEYLDHIDRMLSREEMIRGQLGQPVEY